MNDCIFCKIVNKEIPAHIIYEDDKILAFLDVNPDTNGHTLVIPKNHVLDFFEIDDDLLEYLLAKSRIISDDIKDKLQADGLTLVQNNGDIQIVKHFHLHLKPYYNEKQSLKTLEEIKKLID